MTPTNPTPHHDDRREQVAARAHEVDKVGWFDDLPPRVKKAVEQVEFALTLKQFDMDGISAYNLAREGGILIRELRGQMLDRETKKPLSSLMPSAANVTYRLPTGEKIPMPGTQFVPSKGDLIHFLSGEAPRSAYRVEEVQHVVTADEVRVEVVLR